LGFTLLADVDGGLARVFGVLKDRLAQRSTFVVDRELTIRRRYDNVLPRGHAQRVLDFVQSLLESHRMLGG
jgi:peroxiredoxin